MGVRIRRALFSCSDKTGIVDLARCLAQTGAELVATGKTASVLKDAGLNVTPIEKISRAPEAFQGRMKTLSFPVCSGILYRRGDASDEADLKRLEIEPVDAVIVNFYPFEAAAAQPGMTQNELIEQVDIGGPTLVRAAAKNAPNTLVLVEPSQYGSVIQEVRATGEVSAANALRFAAQAWDRVLAYDQAIADRLGEGGARSVVKNLRYGENPHQAGRLEFDSTSPIDWGAELTHQTLSYNNILDLSAAYGLASDLCELRTQMGEVGSIAVIVKHGNPCGVAWVPGSDPSVTQVLALQRAWAGDPVSSFGGVVVLTEPLTESAAEWLSTRFIELLAAPQLAMSDGSCSSALKQLLTKRKNLKAVPVRQFGVYPGEQVVSVPGGLLKQTVDRGFSDALTSVTQAQLDSAQRWLAYFGIAVCRSLKSNSIALVRTVPATGAPSGNEAGGGFQLVGAGQGQPNRVEALEILAVPRARRVLEAAGDGTKMEDLLMVSDAFFPFRDTVDVAYRAGLRTVIQPGGSMRDAESIEACNEHKMTMVFTGVRHFKH